MMIVHEDNNYLYTLLEDLRGIAEVASTALDKPGGSDWPLLLDYHNEIAMLWSKIHKLNVEQWDIEAACRKELADLLIWLAGMYP